MNLDRFYETFIARDVFAKVVPGGILLLTVIWWLNGGNNNATTFIMALVKQMPGWGWLFIYGVCYIVGFSIQKFGEITRIIYSIPLGEKYAHALERVVDFDRSVTNLYCRAARERLIVIKEATGNVFISSLISLVIWIAAYGPKTVFCDPKLIIFVIIAGVGFLCLWWFHIQTRWRQLEIEKKMINPAHKINDHPFLW